MDRFLDVCVEGLERPDVRLLRNLGGEKDEEEVSSSNNLTKGIVDSPTTRACEECLFFEIGSAQIFPMAGWQPSERRKRHSNGQLPYGVRCAIGERHSEEKRNQAHLSSFGWLQCSYHRIYHRLTSHPPKQTDKRFYDNTMYQYI